MKKITMLLICVLFINNYANGQIKDPAETVKDRTTDKVNQKSDELIDSGLNKIEEGINSIFKKKDKKEKKKKDKKSNSSSNSGNSNSQDETDFTKYEDFDFIPGQKVLFFDDFSSGNTSNWKSQEPLSVEYQFSQNWMRIHNGPNFYIHNLGVLPNDFTVEFDVYIPSSTDNTGTFSLRFLDKNQISNLIDPYLDNVTEISFSPNSQTQKNGVANVNLKKDSGHLLEDEKTEVYFTDWHQHGNRKARISISKKGNLLSVHLNEKILFKDLPAFLNGRQHVLGFHQQTYFQENVNILITNLRIATDAPNAQAGMKNGKFVTNTIYFDVNSSKIKAESWSTLNNAAQAIKSTSGNILIVGHTDSDGADDTNLTLSKNRAISVKNALVNEFGIDASRIITDGKGEAEPIESNATSNGKAQNRRVEFIKL